MDNEAERASKPASEGSTEEQERKPVEPFLWLEEYGDYLFRYAYQRLGSRETAEDLVQDALLSAYKAFDTFEGKAAVKTWLVSILRNKIIDHLRRGNRVQFVSLEGMSESNTADDSFNRMGIWKRIIPSWGSDPGAVVENKAFMKQLQECIDVLPDSMRSVFAFKMIDQMNTKEICDSLEISENNVWVILHRARMKVRNCLEINWLGKEES